VKSKTIISFSRQICRCASITFLSIGLVVSLVEGTATITITPTTKYQTIDGFGAFSYEGTGIGGAAFFHDSLGGSIVRLRLPSAQMQSSNNMTDSTNSDLTKFSTSSLNEQVDIINSLKNYGDVKFYASSWSPPAWMKDNNSITNGGRLLTRYYVSYAGLLSGFCKIIKSRTSVDILAISLQNEPRFVEVYQSCVFTPAEYTACLKMVGARLKKDGLPTTCFGAEDMVEEIVHTPYISTIAADTAAVKYISAVAVHGYLDGVHPILRSQGAAGWGRCWAVASGMGKKLWMTETSGYAQNDWSIALNQLAGNLYCALKYGCISANTYWRCNDCSTEGLACNGRHTQLSIAAESYYKFIRPGAVQVKCDFGGTDTLYPVAFYHAANKTLSIVVLNQMASTNQMTLVSTQALPATFAKYTSTSTKKCVSEGNVSSSSAISIDPSSITSLVGSNYTVDVVPKEKPVRVLPQVVSNQWRYYRIDGTTVKGVHYGSRGVYISERETEKGKEVLPITIFAK
jgi:glucuronoarabinoxylan endo-1,4-beta-xylanase